MVGFLVHAVVVALLIVVVGMLGGSQSFGKKILALLCLFAAIHIVAASWVIPLASRVHDLVDQAQSHSVVETQKP